MQFIQFRAGNSCRPIHADYRGRAVIYRYYFFVRFRSQEFMSHLTISDML